MSGSAAALRRRTIPWELRMHAAFWLRVGAIWGFLAVAMGAFGAHGLQERFRTLGEVPGGLATERLQANFHTAAQYHMDMATERHSGGKKAADNASKPLKNSGLQQSGPSTLKLVSNVTKRTETHGNAPTFESGATQSATRDSDLDAIVEAWPTLPEALKAGILAMVRSAVK